MFSVPGSFVAGVLGLIRDQRKGPAVLGLLFSGGLLSIWILAEMGVLWC